MRALGKVCTFVFYDGARHGFAVRTHPGYPRSGEASFDEAKRFCENLPVTDRIDSGAADARVRGDGTNGGRPTTADPAEPRRAGRVLPGTQEAALATIDKDGFPHVVAINYFARDGAFY